MRTLATSLRYGTWRPGASGTKVVNPDGSSFPVAAGSAFLKEKCSSLQGRCVNSCQKDEELVALCLRFLRCCRAVRPCTDGADGATGPEDWVPRGPHGPRASPSRSGPSPETLQ